MSMLRPGESELRQRGKLCGVIIPYLGQDDSRLKFPPSDLVTREEAYAYPTDFSAMSPAWIDRLSKRGEQRLPRRSSQNMFRI